MNTALRCCLGVLLVLVVLPVEAAEDLVLYDNFAARFIDVNKWVPGEAPGGLVGEAVREIHGHRLRLVYRAYGNLGSNMGDVGGRNALVFPDPAAVTAIEARVAVKEFEATGCAENPEPTQARARIFGAFFRLPNPRLPGSPLTLVLADIRIVRVSNATDRRNVLRVISRLFQCDDAACIQGEIIHEVDWGTLNKGESATLRIQWDDASKTFFSQRDEMAEDAHTLAAAVAFPAGSKRLEIAPVVVNCFGPPRPVSYTEAFFDDVRVNR
jgi:hypothetical protein